LFTFFPTHKPKQLCIRQLWDNFSMLSTCFINITITLL